MARFVFLGGPECGDVAECEMFDRVFPLDEPVEVDDARAAAKLRANRFFAEAPAVEGDDPPHQPRRRGRPPKVSH